MCSHNSKRKSVMYTIQVLNLSSPCFALWPRPLPESCWIIQGIVTILLCADRVEKVTYNPEHFCWLFLKTFLQISWMSLPIKFPWVVLWGSRFFHSSFYKTDSNYFYTGGSWNREGWIRRDGFTSRTWQLVWRSFYSLQHTSAIYCSSLRAK